MKAQSATRTSNSTRLLMALGAALALFGLLWAVCFAVSGGRYPILGADIGNVFIALALGVIGVVLILVGASRPRIPK